MIRSTFILLILLPALSYAQQTPSCYREHFNGDLNAVYKRMNTPAQLEGGDSKWISFVEKNLNASKIEDALPDSIRAREFSDSATVRFIVTKEGFVSNIGIVQGDHYGIAEEAVRVIIASCEKKKWIPAIDSGGVYRDSWVAMKFHLIIIADMVSLITARAEL